MEQRWEGEIGGEKGVSGTGKRAETGFLRIVKKSALVGTDDT